MDTNSNIALTKSILFNHANINSGLNLDSKGFKQLLDTQTLVDCTLACDGGKLSAHKIVLSACSNYLAKILLDHPVEHPIIILPELNIEDVRTLVHYMYTGELLKSNTLNSAGLLRTAAILSVNSLNDLIIPQQQQPSTLDYITAANNNNNIMEQLTTQSQLFKLEPQAEQQQQRQLASIFGPSGLFLNTKTSLMNHNLLHNHHHHQQPPTSQKQQQQQQQHQQQAYYFGRSNLNIVNNGLSNNNNNNNSNSSSSSSSSSGLNSSSSSIDSGNSSLQQQQQPPPPAPQSRTKQSTSSSKSSSPASSSSSSSTTTTTTQQQQMNDYQFNCPICRNDFQTICSFEYHLQRVHNITSFNCEICKKPFASLRYVLTDHMRRCHGARPVDPSNLQAAPAQPAQQQQHHHHHQQKL